MNIASEFANYDSRLAFAGTNEVHIRDNWGKPTAENLEVQNAYNQIFVDMVRATGGNNAKRHLILQTTFVTLGLASRMEISSFQRMPKAMATTI